MMLFNRRLLLLLPGLLIIVFLLHFHELRDLLEFEVRYVPRPPREVVNGLIAAGGKRPWIHDPHVLAYLALPLFLLTAATLYDVGKAYRPGASLAAASLTAVGTVYLGGLFGMWTAFYGGISRVDAQYSDGAVATFSALTENQGAFLLTTSLAKLAFIGIFFQMLVLWKTPGASWIGIISACAGCTLFLAFWDLDNWMLLGSVLLFIGFSTVQRAVRRAPVSAA